MMAAMPLMLVNGLSGGDLVVGEAWFLARVGSSEVLTEVPPELSLSLPQARRASKKSEAYPVPSRVPPHPATSEQQSNLDPDAPSNAPIGDLTIRFFPPSVLSYIPCFTSIMALSGLQREVLSLYRQCLRACRAKPAVTPPPPLSLPLPLPLPFLFPFLFSSLTPPPLPQLTSTQLHPHLTGRNES